MARKVAKNEFEKDFCKHMSNSVFGMTMENLRNISKIKIVNGRDENRLLRYISKPNFRGYFIITTLFEYGAISLFIKIYKTIYKEQKKRKRKN